MSPPARAHWEKVRRQPGFGAPGNAFNLDGLRQGMGLRQEPADPAVRCLRASVDGMNAEWVLAPRADPDLRLLHLHGGGYVSGAGANYLPLAALRSAAAGCAVLLPDHRLAPEHRFPASLEDGVEVAIEVWPGMVHVFRVRGLPESREAVARLADFMRACLKPVLEGK